MNHIGLDGQVLVDEFSRLRAAWRANPPTPRRRQEYLVRRTTPREESFHRGRVSQIQLSAGTDYHLHGVIQFQSANQRRPDQAVVARDENSPARRRGIHGVPRRVRSGIGRTVGNAVHAALGGFNFTFHGPLLDQMDMQVGVEIYYYDTVADR